MENNCIVCEHSLRRCRRHILNEHFVLSRPDFRQHIPQAIPIDGTRSMCNACFHLIGNRINRRSGEQPPAHDIAADSYCVQCQHSLLRRRSHVLNADLLEARRDIVEYILRDLQPPQEIPLDGTRAVCHTCWVRIDSIINRAPIAQPRPAQPSTSMVVQGLTRAANTSRRCMIRNCNNQQLRFMPNSIKIHLLSYCNIYIPPLARICNQHIRSHSLEELIENIAHEQSEIYPENVQDIIQMFVRDRERRNNLDFENIDEMSEDDLYFWTGSNHQKFNILSNQLPTLQRRSSTPKVDLAVYLCKLRNAEPNTRIGVIFGFSRHTVGRKIRLVRSCLTTDFVPLHIGLDHLSREETIRRNRLIPQYIFGSEENPKSIIILDGTYLFVEKSSNYLFQRQSYSLHKYRNLVKPFMIVCADGHILDIIGPYAATTSDADILRQILTNHGDPIEDCAWHYFFQENDVLILDRGFRDAIPIAREFGYEAHMPPSNARGQRQLSAQDSNKSRLVTICRWVVEAINGRLKRDFKMFRHRVFNRDLPHVFEDFKIAGALINCFQEPFHDSEYTDAFIEIIHRNVHKPNLLADYVHDNNLNQQRVAFRRLEATSEEVSDFPALSYEDLIMIAIGTYHPKIARSYCNEHINATGVYEIEFYRHSEGVNINEFENNVLIRCRIQSRHVRRRQYYTYVLYNRELEGRNAIVEYYCSCVHGCRTLGVCAHVMTVIYYLGLMRNNPEPMNHPAQFLNEVLRDVEIE